MVPDMFAQTALQSRVEDIGRYGWANICTLSPLGMQGDTDQVCTYGT